MIDHPSLPGRIAPRVLADAQAAWPVAETTPIFSKPFLSVRSDAIVDPTGTRHDRVVVEPHGAIGVLAIDDNDRVLLVQQYRHPLHRRLLEIPAGTLDVDGESSLQAAQRELVEEGDIVAAAWDELFTMAATPGYSTETWVIFRATGLAAVPATERTEREAEEAGMEQWWIPLDEAVAAIFDGRITDAMTVAAILAEQVRQQR